MKVQISALHSISDSEINTILVLLLQNVKQREQILKLILDNENVSPQQAETTIVDSHKHFCSEPVCRLQQVIHFCIWTVKASCGSELHHSGFKMKLNVFKVQTIGFNLQFVEDIG